MTDTLDPRNAEDNDLTTKYYNLHALTSALTVRFEYPQARPLHPELKLSLDKM